MKASVQPLAIINTGSTFVACRFFNRARVDWDGYMLALGPASPEALREDDRSAARGAL
eukprot:SAG11_NODE_9795_length_880_cov_0.921895_1_plen_57_part_10